MAAKTIYRLLLALFVVQCVADDIDIVEVLKNPSILIDELKEKIKNVEDDIKNGVESLLAKAKDAFGDVEQKIEEEVAKGSASAQCLLGEKDQLIALATTGGQDLSACTAKVLADLAPLTAEVATTVKDITELAEECAGGDAAAIAACVAVHVGNVGTAVKDIGKAIADIPSSYTSLKSDVQVCDTNLSADTDKFKALWNACV